MPVVLSTNRLIIRDIIDSDEAFFHLLRTDAKITRHQNYFCSKTAADTNTWITTTITNNQATPRVSYNFAILTKDTRELIGWIGFGEADDITYGDHDFGYAIASSQWSKGYATEALIALLQFAFNQTSADTIAGDCRLTNTASARVMEKAGMRKMGIYGDTVVYTANRIPSKRHG